MKMTAKLNNGLPVVVTHENKGDVVPGFTEDGKPYPAYTSMIQLTTFVSVDKKLADESGNANALREAADTAAMETLGIDLETLKDIG